MGYKMYKWLKAKGFLSDHYNPLTKIVALSSHNFREASVAGTAIAAHEVGHAIQDKEAYAFLRFRHRLAPVASITSNASWVFIMIGVDFLKYEFYAWNRYCTACSRSCVPSCYIAGEFNASTRAMNQIVTLGIIRNEEERHAKKVLSAAAMTYVAATAVAVLELVRLILIFTKQRLRSEYKKSVLTIFFVRDETFFILLEDRQIISAQVGRFCSSSVNPSPITSWTSVSETNACGSTDVIIFFKRTISFLPTTQ